MPIPDWMPTVVARLGEITGVVSSRGPDNLPGKISETPIFLTTVTGGSQEVGGSFQGVHRVQSTLYVANQVLPEAQNRAIPFIDLTLLKVAANMQLGGIVDHWLPLTPAQGFFYEGPGGVEYGAKADRLLGIIFRWTVKERNIFTVAVGDLL